LKFGLHFFLKTSQPAGEVCIYLSKRRYALHDRLMIRFRKTFSVVRLASISARVYQLVILGGISGQFLPPGPEDTNEAKLLLRAKDQSHGLCGVECRLLCTSTKIRPRVIISRALVRK
jgi:hypothetical protein